jgi:hypothetical protein
LVFFFAYVDFGARQISQAYLLFLVMFGIVALAWRWPKVGAVVLLAIGVSLIFHPFIFVDYITPHGPRLADELMMFAMLPLPPLASGALLLFSRHQ